MIEHSLSQIDSTGHIGLLCEDCGAKGQIKYEMGEEQPWNDPSVCEGVSDMSVAEINWIDCPPLSVAMALDAAGAACDVERFRTDGGVETDRPALDDEATRGLGGGSL